MDLTGESDWEAGRSVAPEGYQMIEPVQNPSNTLTQNMHISICTNYCCL